MNGRVAVWIVIFAILGIRTVWAGENVWTSLGPMAGGFGAGE
jgi:hypothetical protein